MKVKTKGSIPSITTENQAVTTTVVAAFFFWYHLIFYDFVNLRFINYAFDL